MKAKLGNPETMPVNETSLYHSLFISSLLINAIGVFYYVFIPAINGANYQSRIDASRANVRHILTTIHVYTADWEQWPATLEESVEYSYPSGIGDLLENPQAEYIGYAFEPPEVLPDQDGIDWSKVPVVFEICLHDGIVRDSGVIGYADGHVQYLSEDE